MTLTPAPWKIKTLKNSFLSSCPFLLLSRLMRWEMFLEFREGGNVLPVMGPHTGNWTINEPWTRNTEDKNCEAMRIKWLKFYEFSPQCLWSVARKAALVCDGGAMSSEASGAGDRDSWRQLAAAGGHSTGLTLPRLPHASSAQQTLGVKTTFLLPFITNRHIKRHLNQPKVLDLWYPCRMQMQSM